MKRRLKNLIAIMVAAILVLNYIPQSLIEAVAANYDITDGNSLDVEGDHSEDYYTVMGSGATATLNVLSGANVGTISVSGDMSVVTINSSTTINELSVGLNPTVYSEGTITTATVEGGTVTIAGGSVTNLTSVGGEVTITGGYISNLSVDSGIMDSGDVDFTGGRVDSIQVFDGALNLVAGTYPSIEVSGYNAVLYLQGDISIADFSYDGIISGAYSVTVTDSLYVGVDGYSDANINVTESTHITTDADCSVFYNGVEYQLYAGLMDVTMNDLFYYDISGNNLDFGVKTEGYDAVTEKTITITNGGQLDASISLGTSADFTVSATLDSVAVTGNTFLIPVEGSVILTFAPKGGLEVGTYQEEFPITVADKTEIVNLNFKVSEKPAGTGSVTMADYYYGGKASNPVVASTTNGVGNVKVEYKVYKAADSTYTTKVPTAVGDYTVRVTFPGNDSYATVYATDDFSIGYLPIPQSPYSIEGTKGDNNYYNTSVNIIPAEGYLVSTSLDGEYKESVTYNVSTYLEEIYFKKIATGEKTDKLVISDIRIDAYAPSIPSIKDKDTYYADDMDVIINDANLLSVTINGEDVEVIGTRATAKLQSDGGIEEYEIVATDIAGNVTTVKITVAAEWVKDNIIPNGKAVKLLDGKSYKLSSGQWTVSGDATVYNGNTTFYVSGDGKYTFTQQ